MAKKEIPSKEIEPIDEDPIPEEQGDDEPVLLAPTQVKEEDAPSDEDKPEPTKPLKISKEEAIDDLDEGIGEEPKKEGVEKAESARPDSSSQVMDYHKYLITPEDIQSVASAKRTAATMGAVGNALGNQQSVGNFWLGRMAPKNDISGSLNQMAQAAAAPIQAKQQMMAQYKAQPELDLSQQMRDPTSSASKLVASNAVGAISALKPQTPEQAKSWGALKTQLASGKMDGYTIKNTIDSDPLLKEAFSANIQGQKMNQMFARLDMTNETKAQTMVNNDHTLNTYLPRLDGAKKILALMKSGENGEFATNKALLGQLNAEIGRLETGSQSPGLAAGEKTEMNDAAAALHDIYDTATGKVTGVDLKAKFAQARGMVGDLAKSYYNQINDRMDTLKSGALPSQMPVFEAKHNTLNHIYQKGFGNLGYDITGGQGEKSGGFISSANAGEDTVSVVSPEGTPGKIPRAKLDQALKRGFKVNGQ